MRSEGPRDPIAGPDSSPESGIFPLKLSGRVIKGFGRGSKEVIVLILFPYDPDEIIKLCLVKNEANAISTLFFLLVFQNIC
jgi:hypothetical protein